MSGHKHWHRHSAQQLMFAVSLNTASLAAVAATLSPEDFRTEEFYGNWGLAAIHLTGGW